jgi:methyltransferase-like protein
MDDFRRQVLQRLDGQHTRATLAQELAAVVQSGQLTIQQQGEKVTRPERINELVRQAQEQCLGEFARQALLLG